MVIKTRVRGTSPALVFDTQVQHQWHRSRNIRQVGSQLDVATSLIPALNHLLSLYPMWCVKQVSELLDCPMVSLFGSGMDSTGANMIVKNITDRLFATTSREWQLCQSGYLCIDTSGKEGLSETSRPGLIPAMRSNHPEKTQRIIPQDPPRGAYCLLQ